MATAEEYAKWIVENQDKKDTPEFQTVAKAYQVARQQPAQAPAAPQQPDAPQWQKSALNVARDTIQRGPFMGPLTGLMSESQKMLDRGAYDIGGKVTDATGSPLAGFAANVATQAIPTVLGGLGAEAAMSGGMKTAGKTLMHSALKPQSKDILSGDAAKAVQTMLDEGVNVSTGGAVKLRSQIHKLEAEVQKQISESGAVVDKAHVMKEVHEVLEKFRNQVNSADDVAKVMKSWEETTSKLAAKIPVRQAHDLKQGTYKALSDKYAKIGAVENEASVQAQMAAARGLRLGTEEVVPGVAGLTKKESALINALEMTERRAGISGNKDIAGIAWLAQNPAAATAMMMDRSSAFKSWLANRIYQMRNAAPTAVGAGAAGLYQGSTQND